MNSTIYTVEMLGTGGGAAINLFILFGFAAGPEPPLPSYDETKRLALGIALGM